MSGSGRYATGQANTMTYGGQTYAISKPTITNMIHCFKDKPVSDALVFDAEFVAKSVMDKYGNNQMMSPAVEVL